MNGKPNDDCKRLQIQVNFVPQRLFQLYSIGILEINSQLCNS